MKKLLLLCSLLLSTQIFAKDYPRSPETSFTTGRLCEHADSFRYAEKIAYCERDVSYELKNQVFRYYDEQFGYHVRSMRRDDFKIDHFIPLCAGGSNDITNLWPQHKSIYAITDPLEPVVCEKMAKGLLKQSDAIALIVAAKTNLSRVNEIFRYVDSL